MFEDSVSSNATVFNWFAEFKRDMQPLKMNLTPIAVTPENIFAVEKLIKNYRRLTYVAIENRLGTGSAAVQNIIHHQLRLSQRC